MNQTSAAGLNPATALKLSPRVDGIPTDKTLPVTAEDIGLQWCGCRLLVCGAFWHKRLAGRRQGSLQEAQRDIEQDAGPSILEE